MTRHEKLVDSLFELFAENGAAKTIVRTSTGFKLLNGFKPWISYLIFTVLVALPLISFYLDGEAFFAILITWVLLIFLVINLLPDENTLEVNTRDKLIVFTPSNILFRYSHKPTVFSFSEINSVQIVKRTIGGVPGSSFQLSLILQNEKVLIINEYGVEKLALKLKLVLDTLTKEEREKAKLTA